MQFKAQLLKIGLFLWDHFNRWGQKTRWMGISITVLTVLLVLSSMALIYAKHTSRQLFAQIQALHEDQEALGREWTQLLLEQGTWASNSRVEKKAKENLGMSAAPAASIVVIKEKNT